jgi:uncharacterized protein YegP (UPF0339 family)
VAWREGKSAAKPKGSGSKIAQGEEMKFLIYQSCDQLFRWRLFSEDKEILVECKVGYRTRFDCLSKLNQVKLCAGAAIEGLRETETESA